MLSIKSVNNYQKYTQIALLTVSCLISFQSMSSCTKQADGNNCNNQWKDNKDSSCNNCYVIISTGEKLECSWQSGLCQESRQVCPSTTKKNRRALSEKSNDSKENLRPSLREIRQKNKVIFSGRNTDN